MNQTVKDVFTIISAFFILLAFFGAIILIGVGSAMAFDWFVHLPHSDFCVKNGLAFHGSFFDYIEGLYCVGEVEGNIVVKKEFVFFDGNFAFVEKVS